MSAKEEEEEKRRKKKYLPHFLTQGGDIWCREIHTKRRKRIFVLIPYIFRPI
jgi:hypothetical protein